MRIDTEFLVIALQSGQNEVVRFLDEEDPLRLPSAVEWLTRHAVALEVVPKATADTVAWLGRRDGNDYFAKLYPANLPSERARIEAAIAGGGLHTAIVALRSVVECSDGSLHLYDRIPGENLAVSEVRHRFARLAVPERAAAVLTVVDALAAIWEAGFTVVDWHDGNMLYDFDAGRVWLYDWELCREGNSFELEMNSNYGSSRFQAPEEFVRGSLIDERTQVFNLGRYALLTLPEAAEPLAAILSRATYPARAGRQESVRMLGAELRAELELIGIASRQPS